MKNEEIIDTINQMVIFLNNQGSHMTYGSVSSDFQHKFNPEIDYRTQYAEWYKNTGFYDAETEPALILSKTNDIQPEITSNTELSFQQIRLELDTTWGYGKYFDGESAELTSKSGNLLRETQQIISNYLNANVVLQDDVNVDQNDVILLNIFISDIELDIQLTRDEEMNLCYEEYCDCGEDIYSGKCTY